jgi:hypothetical protein
MTTFLELATPNCTAEELDGELVAINLDTGMYFSVKQDGAAIWKDLQAGYSVEAIKAFAGDNAELAMGIDGFIQQLRDSGLMRATENAPTPNALSLTEQAASTMQMPELESYGDMQNLLLLDPVHEVDGDAGWPHNKA